MISVIIFGLVLGVLILVHEFGHFIVSKKLGIRVEKFSIGFGPRLMVRKSGDTEYSLSAVPFGGYVKLAGDSLEEFKHEKDEYLSRPPLERGLVVFFGPFLNYILGFFCFWFIFVAGYPSLTTRVGGVLDDFGAKAAGIMAGDRILSIDGIAVGDWEELQKTVLERGNDTPALVAIDREGKRLALKVEMKKKEVEDTLGQKRNVGLLGITPADEFLVQRYGVFKSFILSAEKTWDLTQMTYKSLWYLVTGRLSMRDSVTGPLGIFYITHKAAQIGFIAVLHLIAVLSVSLAIFNLLPLPVLDGGHIALLLVEKVRGKYLSARAERVIMQTGFTLIIALAVLVTFNDILKFSDKFLKLFGK